jgi:hypothetical protein
MAGMLPQGMINVADIEIFSEQERPNSGEKNSEKAQARQEALPVNTSERWLFGGGDYFFHSTLDVIRPLWIEGIGGSWNHPRTVFKFPKGKHGIYIHGDTIDLSLNAGSAGISNIRVDALGMSTVAHGVVVEAMCNLSHMLIDFFRGNGLHVLASAPSGNANLFRFDSVSVQHCGSSVNVTDTPLMKRHNRFLTITTVGPHQLQKDDLIWLESADPDPNFPRAVCGVTSIVGPGDTSVTFECLHALDNDPTTFPGGDFTVTASRNYQIVVGHGIYTHGSDANNGTCFACFFTNNAGWGVLEDSQLGNSYWACEADVNGVGPYYTGKVAPGNVFMACYSEEGPNPSEIGTPAIVIGGDHGSALTGSGLFIRDEKSTRLAFTNANGGYVRLGSRDPIGPTAARYLEFMNAFDGDGPNLSIDFDQALPHLYQKMLGFGQFANARSPAFLISGPSSVNVRRGMPIDAGTLVINDRYWLGMTRHETVDRVPDENTGNPTWHLGDRAWNRNVELIDPTTGHPIAAGAPQGWICTGGGTLGQYTEGRTAFTDGVTRDGRTTVVLNEPSSVLKPAMYLVINDTPCFIISISGVTLTVFLLGVMQGGGPGLPIKYNPPDFTMFGSIQAVVPVAKLPLAATAGARAYVSDANATVFGAVVAGGGANFVPVYSDGTNWRVG